MVGGGWLVVDGWWWMVGGEWLVVDGWWWMVGGGMVGEGWLMVGKLVEGFVEERKRFVMGGFVMGGGVVKKTIKSSGR